jgi:hypothetical protein
MKLPKNVLQLIREFSKPMTHPYWRFGTPHALLIRKSPVMKYMIHHIETKIYQFDLHIGRNYSNVLKVKFGEHIFELDQKYIEIYGEELLEFVKSICDNSHINFYVYAKRFLKFTPTLQCKSYVINNKKYYEYVFIKN